MSGFIKKEEPEFEEEDAHVLGDDEPEGEQLELPTIARRQRKPKVVKKRGIGRKKKRKASTSRKTTTGTKRRKKGTRRKRKKSETSGGSGLKIGRRGRFGREKEAKLHIRQNDDVIVVDEEEPKPKPSTPATPKPTPSNILDQIMGAQEKEFGDTKKGPMSGRRSFW